MEATECELIIADWESFACPAHKCHVCNQEENKEVAELQFAVCRRCPMSYHRQCLLGEKIIGPSDALVCKNEFKGNQLVLKQQNSLGRWIPKESRSLFSTNA
ncbi:uncharacterized protein LOC109836645 [Asparagus officinalis]|uniref:uncharacterized protein LOC109836645 n=1 Tax=Asparagus officinalis TaxID=4686 RepID=UPI00098E0FDC|nr:uncharacterized protein LOC109836645 [Asparagus officinalis]